MAYIHRTIELKLTRMNHFFKVILITGARQVGKTTLAKHLDPGRLYVSLDDRVARTLAKSDPAMFFQRYPPPVIIDEVQYAPELFPYIKILVDESEQTGQIWLTGSQQYSMIKNVQESLAGRIGIFQLYGLSKSEQSGLIFENELNFSLEVLLERQKTAGKNDLLNTFEYIWQGSMPQLIGKNSEYRESYYNAYVDTYLMRDILELSGVTDSMRFNKFLKACASLISEQVNYANLARIADISEPTAKDWLRLLVGLGVVYLLTPYFNNKLKRLTKAPKLYFCDSGLAAFLSMWLTKETLVDGAASGHFYENYVVMELVKEYAYGKNRANLTYYRDSNQKEIDVFVELGREIHPLEIKLSAAPARSEIKKFSVLDKTSIERGSGGIVCMIPEVIPIDQNNCYIPSNLL